MFCQSEAYKHTIKKRDKSLKEIQDRMDCLQRSQAYIHNHITKVEIDIADLKKLVLHRLALSESYDAQLAEVN